MICLMLTLLTYLSFKILRNQAGLNNIFLCGSLLMAQAFLLITAHVSSPRPLCTAVGMLTHFLWLWMFVWSFICCFHMFRVFTVKTVGHTTRATCCCGPNSSLLHSVAMSLVCPAAVVSLVVVISLASSGGTRTGYGMDYCYLDTNLLAGLTVVLPIGLVILANIVFFAITVFKIHTTRRKQSHAVFKASDKENLFIYMKLSSITGAFWLIQIFAEGLNIDVLRFIAIITNGLQGVFIFISYMCNKRVYNLYVQRFREKNATSASSISDSHRNETPEHESHKVSTGCSTDNARYTCTCTSNNNTQSKM